MFGQIFRFKSKNEKVFIGKGFILVKLGKLKEAEKCFDKTLELNPNTEEAKEGKKLISLTYKSIPYIK